jgi:hypothetical protein
MDTNELLGTVIVAGVAMKLFNHDDNHQHRHRYKKGKKQKGLLL